MGSDFALPNNQYYAWENLPADLNGVRFIGGRSNVAFKPLFIYFPNSVDWDGEHIDVVEKDILARLSPLCYLLEPVPETRWLRNREGCYTLVFMQVYLIQPQRDVLLKALLGEAPAGVPKVRREAYIDIKSFRYGTHPACDFVARESIKLLMTPACFYFSLRQSIFDGVYPPEVLRMTSGFGAEQAERVMFYERTGEYFHAFANSAQRDGSLLGCFISAVAGRVFIETHCPSNHGCRMTTKSIGLNEIEVSNGVCTWNDKCRYRCSYTGYDESGLSFKGSAPRSLTRDANILSSLQFLNSSFLRAYLGCDMLAFPDQVPENPEPLTGNPAEVMEYAKAKYKTQFLRPAPMAEDPFAALEANIISYFGDSVSMQLGEEFTDGCDRFLPYRYVNDGEKHVYAVSGACGSGKTWYARTVVEECIRNSLTCLYISPRVSQLNDFYRSIQGPRVANYKQDKETREAALVLCCCFHSLGKIVKIPARFDVVIFDEVLTAELCDFSSEVVHDRCRLENKLAWVMAASKVLFMMDAEYNPFVTLFMSSLGRMKYAKEDSFFASERQHLNFDRVKVHRMVSPMNPVINQDRVQLIANSKEVLLMELIAQLRQGKRCALFVSNKTDILAVKGVLLSFLGRESFNALKVVEITRDAGLPRGTVGQLVDEKNCRLLIYSSKISVGTSVDAVFDSVFALITSDHVSALALRQAMERIRHFKVCWVAFTTTRSFSDVNILKSKCSQSVEKLATDLYKSARSSRSVLDFTLYDQPAKDAVSFSGLMRNCLYSVQTERGLWGSLYVAFSASLTYRGRTYLVCDENCEFSEEVKRIWDTRVVQAFMTPWDDQRVSCMQTDLQLDVNECIGVPEDDGTLVKGLYWYDFGAIRRFFRDPEYAELTVFIDRLKALGFDPMEGELNPELEPSETAAEYRMRYPGFRPSCLMWTHQTHSHHRLAPFQLGDKINVPIINHLPERIPNLMENLLVLRLFHAQQFITDPVQLKMMAIEEKMMLIPRLETWRQWAKVSCRLKALKKRCGFPLIEIPDKEEADDNPFEELPDYVQEDKGKKVSVIFREVFGFGIKEVNTFRGLIALYNRYLFRFPLEPLPEFQQIDNNYLDFLEGQARTVETQSLDSTQLTQYETGIDNNRVGKLKRKYFETELLMPASPRDPEESQEVF